MNLLKKYLNEIILCFSFFITILLYNLNIFNHYLFYTNWSESLVLLSFIVLIISAFIYIERNEFNIKKIFKLIVSLLLTFLISIVIINSNYFRDIKINSSLYKISKMEKDYKNSTEYNELKNLILDGNFSELSNFNKKRLIYRELSFINVMLIRENNSVKDYYNEANKDGFLNQVELDNIDLRINESLLRKMK